MKTLTEKDFAFLRQLVKQEQDNYQSVLERSRCQDWEKYVNAMQTVEDRLLATEKYLSENLKHS